MPIYGLESIFRKNCLNFEPTLLCNTKVVISGMDFAGVVLRQTSNRDQKYGGEYLAYYIKLKECLARLQKCQITPYFTFSGAGIYLANQIQSRLLKRIGHLLNPTETDDCFPPRIKGATIEALREIGYPFQILHNSSIRDAAALADFWGCPLLANSSDCYALVSSLQLRNKSKQSSVRPFIPLYLASIDQIPADNSDPSALSALSAHAFRAERSELKVLCPSYRILAALLLGSDSLPVSQLPPDAQTDYESRDRSLHPKHRRWQSVVSWLAKFPPNSEEPIKQIIEANTGNDEQTFVKLLAECITCYIFHPDTVGKRLAAFYEKKCIDVVEDISEDFSLFSLNDDAVTLQDIVSLLQGQAISRLEQTDFTTGWPVRLIHAYRSAKVISSFFSPLYSHGSVLTDRKECQSLDFSVHEPSLPIRLIHYRIMVGLERQLGGCAKLVGLNPHATEYVRRGQELVSYVIPVTALMLNISQDHTDRVLGAFLGTALPTTPPEPGWIFSLAVAVAFWHRHYPAEEPQQLESLENCSVALAVFACTAASMSESSLDVEVLRQYESLFESLTAEPGLLPSTFSNDSDPDPSCFHIIHYLASIHITYDSLKSLVSLVESILPITHESQVFHFPPFWTIFPSSKLVCAVSLHLDSQEPAKRRHTVLNYWLPRLHRSSKFTAAVSAFNQLLDTALSLQLPSRHVKYTLNAVKIPSRRTNCDATSPMPHARPTMDTASNRPMEARLSRSSPRSRGTPGRGAGDRFRRKSSGPNSSSGQLTVDSSSPTRGGRTKTATLGMRVPHPPLTDSNGNRERDIPQMRTSRYPRQRGASAYSKRLRQRLGDPN